MIEKRWFMQICQSQIHAVILYPISQWRILLSVCPKLRFIRSANIFLFFSFLILAIPCSLLHVIEVKIGYLCSCGPIFSLNKLSQCPLTPVNTKLHSPKELPLPGFFPFFSFSVNPRDYSAWKSHAVISFQYVITNMPNTNNNMVKVA